MILDAYLQLSSGQQVTADAVSTNTIDNGNVTPKRRLGDGEPMGLMFAITAVGTNTGSTKLQAIQSASDNLGSAEIIGELDLATADIAAGKVYIVPIGRGKTALRYLGAYHDITGTVDYTVDCFFGPLSMLSAKAESYAKGYTIS